MELKLAYTGFMANNICVEQAKLTVEQIMDMLTPILTDIMTEHERQVKLYRFMAELEETIN